MRMHPAPRTAAQRRLGIGLLALATLTAVAVLVALVWNFRPVPTAESSSHTPHTTDTRPSVAFLGDSFTAGAGASTTAKRWTRIIADDKDWREINFGAGGTNYATKVSVENGDPYVERVDEVIAAGPDIVIVSTAGNSMDTDQSDGITETFEALREGLPEAQIIATSPFARAGAYPDQLKEFGAEIKTSVESVGGTYVDIGHPLKNSPEAMAEDGLHPNDDGYQRIAAAVGDALTV